MFRAFGVVVELIVCALANEQAIARQVKKTRRFEGRLKGGSRSMDRSKEVAMLSQTNRLIAEAERAVIDQIVDFDKERVAGHDTAIPERTLRAFTDKLKALRKRRELIVGKIQQIDCGLITGD